MADALSVEAAMRVAVPESAVKHVQHWDAVTRDVLLRLGAIELRCSQFARRTPARGVWRAPLGARPRAGSRNPRGGGPRPSHRPRQPSPHGAKLEHARRFCLFLGRIFHKSSFSQRDSRLPRMPPPLTHTLFACRSRHTAFSTLHALDFASCITELRSGTSNRQTRLVDPEEKFKKRFRRLRRLRIRRKKKTQLLRVEVGSLLALHFLRGNPCS